MSRKTRKCPYCKSKVSYFGALSELNNGEHTCRNCYKNSNISYDKMIYIPAIIALVLGIIVAAMFFLFKIIKNLILALVLILVPFAAFYFVTPLFFMLEEIKNEAQTPVMFEPKRAARAEKQSRTLKSDENAKADNSVKEQKSIEKRKSGGGKFSKFVRTYIIVPDDEEENEAKNDKKNPEPKIENKLDLIEQEKEHEPELNAISKTNVSEPSAESFVDLVSGSIVTEKNKALEKPEIDHIPKKSDDKPKLNFNKLFSKLNFSDNKKTDTPTNRNIPAENSDSKSDETANSGGMPVYHRLTKTNKVNFIYYPDKKAIISVDLNVPDEEAAENKNDVVEPATSVNDAEIEFTENFAEEENNDVTEAIEMVVEKALEVEKDEEENREIINFFSEKPNESDEESDSQNQSNNAADEYEDDWVEYKPEIGDFITLDLDKPENIDVPKNKINTDNIIGLSDVNFDIPESQDIDNISVRADDEFINYDTEDKLPVIVVEDSQKKLSEFDRSLFENNPAKFEWNVFSSEKVDFKPDIVDFNNNLIDAVVDDEVDYKKEFEIFSQNVTESIQKNNTVTDNTQNFDNIEAQDKHKFGLFSKYVSKIKNESVFNFNKSEKSTNDSSENPTEILEFKENLPEEVKVDEVIKFDSEVDSDNNNEHTEIITADDYIEDDAAENDDENEFDAGEAAEAEPELEENFSKSVDIEEIIENATNDNELLKNVTELDIESISVTNDYDENNYEELKEDFSENPAELESVSENATDEEEISEDENFDDISQKKTLFDMDYESVADEVVNVELESTEIAETEAEEDESEEDESEVFKPEVFMYTQFAEQENDVEDEPVNVEENDDYYRFDEEDDEVPEEDEDYYRFDEEDQEISEEENTSENAEDYYRFDEEEDEEINEFVEGALEYIPEEKNEDSYIVDYSSDKNDDFEDISSGEQLDENFNLEEFRAMRVEDETVNVEEKIVTEPIIPIKIDSSGNRIDDSEKTSRYEKKFPNAAKAAAEQAAALELKKQREQQKAKAKKKKSSSEAVKKNSQKTKENRKKDSQKKEPQKSKKNQTIQDQKTGFFSGLKNKIIEATEEERQAAFEEEERERKLAEKEARRKAKEKEKEKAEKLKAREEKESNKVSAGANTVKSGSEKLDNQAKADAEERKKKSQKTKRIEKSKVKIPSDVPADGKTIVFESSGKTNDKEYEAQEKIVLDSVKDKVKELENKKVTEAEKVKIISEKVDEEKRLEKIEKLKSEQEEQRVQKEKKRREKQLQNERLEKAEEIRREQVKQVRKNQNERKKSEEKRDTNNVSLKEVDNVRSKVSQKKKKRKQEINEVL